MSTPVKNTKTSSSKNSKTKTNRKGRSVADDNSAPTVEDLTVTSEDVELTLDQPSTGDVTLRFDSPPPPEAGDATGSDRRPPSNRLPARLLREAEPMARASQAATLLTSPFNRKVGGVAPFVTPRRRLSRKARLRELGQRGFVPLSPGKQKLRHRILPRSVIGIATMLMCVGIGSAFSGAAFYAYYDDRLAENERTVARFVTGFDQQFTDAAGALDDLRVDAVEEIRVELGPLEDQVTDAQGVITLPQEVGPSVWMLETRNESGEIVNGAAFAIVGHRGGTALVTSYELTLASTTAPSPGIDIVKGNRRIPAQLWAWDAERDLALVVVSESIPPLKLAGENAQLESIGRRVFAMSGVGGQGATASPGVLLDQSLSGLQHTVPVGTLFTGGPLVDGEGRVVGVAATNYRPYGLDPGAVSQAPDVRSICAVVLECSEIKEEVIVEVVNEETDAPARGDEPVREVEVPDPAEEQAEQELGEANTIDPDEIVEGEDGDVEGPGGESSE